MTWSLVLAKRMGPRIWAVLAFIAGAGLVSFFLFDRSLLWATVAMAISFLCFGHLFFVHRYELDAEGLRITTWFSDRRRRWSEFNELALFTYGAELMTRSSRSRLGFLRSQSLFLPSDDQAIIAFIRARLEEANASELVSDSDGQDEAT